MSCLGPTSLSSSGLPCPATANNNGVCPRGCYEDGAVYEELTYCAGPEYYGENGVPCPWSPNNAAGECPRGCEMGDVEGFYEVQDDDKNV